MQALKDQVVVFTGAGSGIGKSVVTRYVEEGARVVAVDISERVADVAAELGEQVTPVVADVATWQGNVLAAQTALERWGAIDVFVGNAGITDGGTPLEDIAGDTLAAAYTQLFGVNVLAPMLGVRACLDGLVAARGRVILTGSFASTNPAGGGVLYTASKHALHGVIRQLAYELAPDVRVNGVAPGVADTHMRGVAALGQSGTDAVLDGTAQVLPTQEVAPVSAYNSIFTLLASATDSTAMTGSLVTVDSGLSIRGLATPGGRVTRRTAVK